MDNIYVKGDVLKLVTIDEEEFIGRFEDMSTDKTKITLTDFKGEGKSADCICHFFRSEIDHIVKLHSESDAPKSFLKITQNEYDRILKVIPKYIYIYQVDEAFHKALDDLKEQEYVAVSTDGAEKGRKCKLPFLTVSSPRNIYIFDIQAMKYHAFEGGLKDILESEYPKKIIHDCRKLSDCLKHKHNVFLNSVFDTQVGDIMITRNKTGRLPKRVTSLQDCLRMYLGLPANYIGDGLDPAECTKRPLSVSIKETLSRNIAFMHRLSEAVHDEFMLPFARGVECYLNAVRSIDDYQAQCLTDDRCLPKDFIQSVEYN